MAASLARVRVRGALRLGCVSLLLLCRQVNAQETAPDEHYRRGVEEARAGHLENARREFEAALELSPHPRVAYNLAKISLELGDRAAAIAYLTRFLAMDLAGVPPEQVNEVKAALLDLQAAETTASGDAEQLREPSPDASPPPPDAAQDERSPNVSSNPGTDQGRATATNEPLKPVRPLGEQQTRTQSLPVHPVRVAEPSNGVAISLTATGAALVLSGLGVWYWNDNNYDSLVSEHTDLLAHPPGPVSAPNDVAPAMQYAQQMGRNQAGFDSVKRFDVVTWSLLGVGTACLSTGLWLLLRDPEAPTDAVGFDPRRFTLRW
ncbi:MAG TPA: hypothetical protein VHM70_18950 [Polyangiaceae bacterium]|nr:hypothetical protein [Polyangiaceae bacterium]